MLLDKDADQSPNVNMITPVDMAGFVGNTETVRTFCKWLEKLIDKENEARIFQGGEDRLANLSLSNNEIKP